MQRELNPLFTMQLKKEIEEDDAQSRGGPSDGFVKLEKDSLQMPEINAEQPQPGTSTEMLSPESKPPNQGLTRVVRLVRVNANVHLSGMRYNPQRQLATPISLPPAIVPRTAPAPKRYRSPPPSTVPIKSRIVALSDAPKVDAELQTESESDFIQDQLVLMRERLEKNEAIYKRTRENFNVAKAEWWRAEEKGRKEIRKIAEGCRKELEMMKQTYKHHLVSMRTKENAEWGQKYDEICAENEKLRRQLGDHSLAIKELKTELSASTSKEGAVNKSWSNEERKPRQPIYELQHSRGVSTKKRMAKAVDHIAKTCGCSPNSNEFKHAVSLLLNHMSEREDVAFRMRMNAEQSARFVEKHNLSLEALEQLRAAIQEQIGMDLFACEQDIAEELTKPGFEKLTQQNKDIKHEEFDS